MSNEAADLHTIFDAIYPEKTGVSEGDLSRRLGDRQHVWVLASLYAGFRFLAIM
jgi:hypothetical protein